MTNEQSLKAFEGVSEDNHMSIINQMICGDALNLINRQKAEIERVKKELTEYKLRLKMSECTVDEIKSEAIKDFTENVCKGRVGNDPVVIAVKAELDYMLGVELEEVQE